MAYNFTLKVSFAPRDPKLNQQWSSAARRNEQNRSLTEYGGKLITLKKNLDTDFIHDLKVLQYCVFI